MIKKLAKQIPYEARLSATFLLIGVIWLLVSDHFALALFKNESMLVKVFLYKEWVFVIMCTVVIFFLTKHLIKKINKANAKAKKHENLQTEFIKNISHELRTPMNAIIGFSELTMSLENTDDEIKEYLKIIEKSSKELLTVVTDLIDTSLLTSGTMTLNNSNFEIQPFIKSVYSYFYPVMNENVRLVLSHQEVPDNYQINSDEEKLRRVFHNLINNAIKYTYKGKIQIGFELSQTEITFFVEDTGVGIKQDLHKNLFKKFKQIEIERLNRSGGSGLGLSICKEMIELLNGKIWLESLPGKGSTFFFSIPVQ
ncbi:sensor histidine kinase [Carboxylicivirga caseinilyticus]|uniref:sensor histidine kinase n=1 Tax=Carboxylicivirga caseinilyticus TaxID=3417572 RepID=UPI003D32CB25|nr:HAMP domain-containing histidine kinase [Marinilabiliaceae bacterium A049]